MSACSSSMHARSRSAASGRVLDQPSCHDADHREREMMLWTIYKVKVASAHVMAERAMMRGQAGGRSNG